MSTERKFIQCAILLLVLVCLPGCGSTKVGSSALVPESIVDNSVVCDASEGAVTVTSMLRSQVFVVEASDFEQGLKNAFSASGLFGGGQKKYDIKAEILELEYPSFGATMDAEYVVKYSILDESGRIVSEKTITSKGTCSMGEHFIGAVRVERAIERAIGSQYKLVVEYVGQAISDDLDQQWKTEQGS